MIEIDRLDPHKPRICCTVCGKSDPVPALSVALLSQAVRDFQFSHARCK